MEVGEFGRVKATPGEKPQVLLIPAISYHILASSYNNQKLRDGLDVLWGLVGIVTPVDEFYILGKLLKLASKAGKSSLKLASRLSEVKRNFRAKPVVLEETAETIALRSEDIDNVLNPYVRFLSGRNGVRGITIGIQDDLISSAYRYLDRNDDFLDIIVHSDGRRFI
ncbi:hypothetical protein [Flammeovirga aprica]|uniref:Uncharacterized protein n=1 Tax=Flammeovirga aprica JL-4 TaxID=694437 RepID=A0A7X9S283_9BACT|nr:hypothetical protein [Flammeovirga aprica]NME72951.1 hypothetical protein [Flammeovirga aprica JL-4]